MISSCNWFFIIKQINILSCNMLHIPMIFNYMSKWVIAICFSVFFLSLLLHWTIFCFVLISTFSIVERGIDPQTCKIHFQWKNTLKPANKTLFILMKRIHHPKSNKAQAFTLADDIAKMLFFECFSRFFFLTTILLIWESAA